ncbi:Rax2p [Sugiyamaella lignohabitans]|uniref:Rax2p n=1 Tax=Sugiyamaella lignohabitans TaxID=796027 RepID=A0A167DZX7_9ASCO|nr:Rax2p [Sugiyamaella lignohabitans]ANB13485.1 Rax2p [Sugiyamaella lignohabitans]
MFTYANNSFNEPLACQDVTMTGGSTLSNSNWQAFSGSGTTYYLESTINDASEVSDVFVAFVPNITYAANYTVHLFTPGCTNDGTCSTRSGVNVTVFPAQGADPVSTVLYETNQFDKYDTVYSGILDARHGFEPKVVVAPLVQSDGQAFPITFVVEKVQFVPNGNITDNNSTISNVPLELNGLFEYNHDNFTRYNSNSSFLPVGDSTFNNIGVSLSTNATVSSTLHLNSDNITIVAGNFSSKFGNNFIAVSHNTILNISGSGLNGPVSSVMNASEITNGGVLVTGNFSNTVDSTVSGLNYIAVYDSLKNKWQPLGSGVDGPVDSVAIFNVNGTTTYAFSGTFSHASNNSVDGFAIWVPSESEWIQQSSLNQSFIDGRLSTSASSIESTDFYFGALRILGERAPSAVYLNSDLSVSPMPFTLLQNFSANSSAHGFNSTSLTRRATIQTTNGNVINTGAFANDSFSILGGHFAATSNQGGGDIIQHVLMLNGDQVSGLPNTKDNFIDSDSEVFALLIADDVLYIGGSISGSMGGGTVGGLVFYDLKNNTYASPQPPPLTGDQAIVTSLNIRPNSEQLVVMGSFTQAGSLQCEAFCIYDLAATRWTNPPSGLTGIISSSVFIGNDLIFFAGAFQLNNTDVYFSQYDFSTSTFSVNTPLQRGVPGPVNSFVLNGVGAESIFASGVNNDTGKTYLSHWNNNNWTSLDSVFGDGSTITQLSLTQLNNNHKANDILPDNELLIVTGNLVLPNFGNVSTAMFDGNSWQPLIITSNQQSSGTVNAFFSQSSQSFSTLLGKHFMKRGFVVLVSLAIAVGLTILVVLLGLLFAYVRRRKQGYQPANARVSELDMTETVPPETLLKEIDNLGGHTRY